MIGLSIFKSTKLKPIMIIGVTVLAIALWIYGFFGFIFYLLGLYAVIYLISRLFKTSSIPAIFLLIGGVSANLLLLAISLYWGFLAIYDIFHGHVWGGLLDLFILMPIIKLPLLYFVFYLISIIIGGPLFLMLMDLEERFGKKESNGQSNLGD